MTKVSTQGYRRGSPDNRHRQLTIPGNRITMADVPYPVYANASNGQQQVMYPGEEHYFPGADYVNEVPLKQQGGYMNNHTGMYWNGKQYRKGNANAAYPGYRDGGHLPMIVPPMYQLWQQGGQVHPQSTHEHWLANRLQTNMNPELAARRTTDSTYAARQLQENPSYVTAANHMYGQFINQNPTSPDIEALKNRIDAYRAAQATYQQQHKQYGGHTNDPLPMDPGARYNLFKHGGIHINPANKGKFNALKARTGKSTEELTHSSNPLTRKRAIFAQNASHWHHQYGGQADSDGDIDIMKDGGNWIKGAVNPAHKGYCTPMTKSTCTGRRRAFAETMKKHHGFHEQGGPVYQQGGYYDFSGAFDDVLSAGLAAGNYFAGQNNARDVHRSAQNQGLSDNMMHMNQPGGHGDYDQSGVFRPDQYTPTRAGNFYPTQQYGGYQHGGVYDMDEKTIQKLRKQGYQLEYI